MTETETLAIEWHCEKLCRLFANYGDQHDFKALCALFAEDGSLYRPSVPEVEIKGRETIYQAFLKRPPLLIRHLASNCVIEVVSATEATGFSLLSFLAAPQSDAPLPLLAGPLQIGEFSDRYVKTAEGWKFQERKGRMTLKTG
ncbi:MAG: nuclear transport factor 2 family protein [Pseudomonadales bacterium]|nr:nuclear transport factor 2 family protein [Pseudomonadales bacterium]